MSAAQPSHSEGPRTGYLVVALGADLVIAIAKLIVGLLTASTAMLSEAAHSFADTTNQIFLLVGIRRSGEPADEAHPYGHGKEQVFWAFLAAVFIFVSGGFFSVYEGTNRLFSAEEHTSGFLWSYVVLGVSMVFSIVSMRAALKEVNTLARESGRTLPQYLRAIPNLPVKTSFYADIAAIIGLLIAAIGLLLVETTGNPRWDGAASIVIGLLLVVVALILGNEARDVLLGSSAPIDTRREIRDAIASFPEIDSIVTLLTMELGIESVLVTGRVDLRDGLTADDVERLLEDVNRKVREAVPEVRNMYLEPRARSQQTTSPSPV